MDACTESNPHRAMDGAVRRIKVVSFFSGVG